MTWTIVAVYCYLSQLLTVVQGIHFLWTHTLSPTSSYYSMYISKYVCLWYLCGFSGHGL